MVHQRPPEWFLSPCTRALHVMQNDATDTEPCKGQGQTFPCSGEAPGHIHPAQRCINPLDSILCDGGPSPPRRPEERQQQDVIGTQGRVICFYLICPCHSFCASPTSFFYLFISLSFSLRLLLLKKLYPFLGINLTLYCFNLVLGNILNLKISYSFIHREFCLIFCD